MADAPPVPITGISIDSRAVQPGHLFVAMKGGSADGHDYIPKAIQKGAAAIVGEQDLSGLAVPYLRMENPRRALTWIAAAYYDWPGRRRKRGIAAVDGLQMLAAQAAMQFERMIGAAPAPGVLEEAGAAWLRRALP